MAQEIQMLRCRCHGSEVALTRSNATTEAIVIYEALTQSTALHCDCCWHLIHWTPCLIYTAICCPPLKHDSTLLIHNFCMYFLNSFLFFGLEFIVTYKLIERLMTEILSYRSWWGKKIKWRKWRMLQTSCFKLLSLINYEWPNLTEPDPIRTCSDCIKLGYRFGLSLNKFFSNLINSKPDQVDPNLILPTSTR